MKHEERWQLAVDLTARMVETYPGDVIVAGVYGSTYTGTLSVLRVLHGAPAQVRRWVDLARSVPPERFRAALSAALPELVVESFGRILSCRERGNTRDIGPAVREVLHEMSQALCLLNGRWVTHDYFEGLTDTFDFPTLPDGYRELVPTLWLATDIAEIVPLAEQLVDNFWRLLAQEGITIMDYQSVEALPL